MQKRQKAIITVLFCTLLTSVAQLIIKLGLNHVDLKNVWTLINANLLGGLILYVIAGVLLIFAMRDADLSLLYPLIGTSFIWVAIMSYFFLHEPMSIIKMGGIACIVLGVGLISRS